MIYGFIVFNNNDIPFVMDDYKLELFGNDDHITDFCKSHNHQQNYILYGKRYNDGIIPYYFEAVVAYSIGTTCYLSCYSIGSIGEKKNVNQIRYKSDELDCILKNQYNYLDFVRNDVNLSKEQKEVYHFTFALKNHDYEAVYRIGRDSNLGLLSSSRDSGELVITPCPDDLIGCLELSKLIQRMMIFIAGTSKVFFSSIEAYDSVVPAFAFYYEAVSDRGCYDSAVRYYQFDVDKFLPPILQNLALDPGDTITKSIPLGHIFGEMIPCTPHRFIEQVFSFEYLFEKLEPSIAKKQELHLKGELEMMFERFPSILANGTMSNDTVSERIKNLRRELTHGKKYHYDFGMNRDIQLLTIYLDKLILKMSLLLIGFSDDEMVDYCTGTRHY